MEKERKEINNLLEKNLKNNKNLEEFGDIYNLKKHQDYQNNKKYLNELRESCEQQRPVGWQIRQKDFHGYNLKPDFVLVRDKNKALSGFKTSRETSGQTEVNTAYYFPLNGEAPVVLGEWGKYKEYDYAEDKEIWESYENKENLIPTEKLINAEGLSDDEIQNAVLKESPYSKAMRVALSMEMNIIDKDKKKYLELCEKIEHSGEKYLAFIAGLEAGIDVADELGKFVTSSDSFFDAQGIGPLMDAFNRIGKKVPRDLFIKLNKRIAGHSETNLLAGLLAGKKAGIEITKDDISTEAEEVTDKVIKEQKKYSQEGNHRAYELFSVPYAIRTKLSFLFGAHEEGIMRLEKSTALELINNIKMEFKKAVNQLKAEKGVSYNQDRDEFTLPSREIISVRNEWKIISPGSAGLAWGRGPSLPDNPEDEISIEKLNQYLNKY